MKYKHLTQEQRYQIYAYSKAHWTQKRIAEELGVHKSSISREKKRNSGFRGYRPHQAHMKATGRKVNARKNVKMNAYLKFRVSKCLRKEWSPEQISGYFKRHNIADISHQSIYTYIAEDKE